MRTLLLSVFFLAAGAGPASAEDGKPAVTAADREAQRPVVHTAGKTAPGADAAGTVTEDKSREYRREQRQKLRERASARPGGSVRTKDRGQAEADARREEVRKMHEERTGGNEADGSSSGEARVSVSTGTAAGDAPSEKRAADAAAGRNGAAGAARNAGGGAGR